MRTLLKTIAQGFVVGAALLVIFSVARADDSVPPLDSPHWMHGKKAIMDVYTIDTTTLDVVATNEFAFATALDCANAMGQALVIANAAVPKGAIAVVKCFAAAKGADDVVKPGKPGTTESGSTQL